MSIGVFLNSIVRTIQIVWKFIMWQSDRKKEKIKILWAEKVETLSSQNQIKGKKMPSNYRKLKYISPIIRDKEINAYFDAKILNYVRDFHNWYVKKPTIQPVTSAFKKQIGNY